MNLRQLDIFGAVAEAQSFSRAAARLHIAQSAVSIAVRKLEGSLQLRLFNRAGRLVTLTAEGEALQRHAGIIQRQFDDARRELADLRGLERGTVRVGIPAMLSSYYFPEAFQAFRRRYPSLSIQVVDAGTRHIQSLLEDAAIDIGLINAELATPQLATHPVIREEMMVCVAAGHAFAARRSVRFRDLLDEHLVVHREGYYLREVLENFFRTAPARPRIDVETNLVPLMKRLVLGNHSVGFCLRSVLAMESELIGIPFTPRVRLPFAIAWKKDRYLSLANRAFADFLRDWSATRGDAGRAR